MSGAERERARALVLSHGWNATCYQILNPGFERWFSDSGDAVVGYVEHHRTRLVGGAPVCGEDRLADVAAEFEANSRREGFRTCYFGAESHLEHIYRDSRDHSMIVLGSQPILRPSGWPRRISSHASLRAQLNRARNKHVRVEEWPSDRARDHPDLRKCLREWLESRGLPPMHFLIETDTISDTADRRLFTASREDEIIGFLVASPVPRRNGWLIEQIVRGRAAVNGTSEILIDAAMGGMMESRSEYVTFGLAPLSTHTESAVHENPLWLATVLDWMRAHGRRYYNFLGLEAFKEKFQPDRWDPVYAIVDRTRFDPSTLYAVAAAFADGSPMGLFGRAVLRALRQEVRDFRHG